MEPDNLIRFAAPVNEKTTSVVSVTFKDENGAAVNPATAKYTLFNVATGAVINSRSAVDVPGSTSTRLIELTPADNVIVDTALQLEEHRLYVLYTYSAGGSKTGSVEIQVVVVNMAKES